MTIIASSFMDTTASSLETGRTAATHLQESLGRPPEVVLTYLTANHDQHSYLRGIWDVLGPKVSVIGCSTQGVIGSGRVREDGYAAGAMALGGDGIGVAHAMAEGIASDTLEKAKLMGRTLREGLAERPQLVILHYDTLCGTDIELFLDALHREVECTILGGAAAHSFFYEELQRTYQYFDDRVLTGAAVACAVSGRFGVEVEACHGCAPVGVEFTVTRAEGTVLLELNGRPATEVWHDIVGSKFTDSSALAIGIPTEGSAGSRDYLVRAAYAFVPDNGGVVLGSAIPVGKRIMLHHRSTEDVVEGAKRMGQALHNRLLGRTVRAALGFECGSRTRPFLGDEATLQENVDLQRAVGEHVPWLGMMAWGEVYPIDGRPTFHNFSYPVLVLTD